MRWQFWQKPVPRVLSDRVKTALTTRFKLDQDLVDQMRVTTKNGQYSSRRVEYLRIFDPSLVNGGAAGSLRYDDLQEKGSHRRALLFEGHIEKDDLGGRMTRDSQVNLRDRRTQ